MKNTLNSTSGNRPTRTIEDYLSVIYGMERDAVQVIPAHLAQSFKVAPPTVTVTLRRMERDGWIVADPVRGIHLTEAGCAAASSVIRRHMLTEWMLASMLNIPWSRIHDEAHQIEHSISEEIEGQLRINLDNPSFCPHGNPFPGFENVAARWSPLENAVAGERVIIRRIHEAAESDPAILLFLEKNNLVPGAQAHVVEVLPFNQTIGLKVGKKKVSIGFSTARYIYFEKVA
jgi:DtxR family transcriptional regulator, Mn-dependent transcriptional regulator